jgi:hypothetical protein
MANYLLIGLALFIFSVITRVWIRLRRKDVGIDTWYFLKYAEGFRRQKKLPVRLTNYLLDIEEQWYPPLLAFMLSFLPKKIVERYHWLISAFIDSLQAILLYIVSLKLTGRFDIALFSTLLYISSTITASMATNLNARPLASLVLTVLMLAIYNFSLKQSILSFILIIVFGIILLHTHKMASQQFLFFAIGFALLTGKISYLFILLAIVITCLAATGGFYLKILKNNIQIVRYWAKNLPYLEKHQVYASPLYKNTEKAKMKTGLSGMKTHKAIFLLAKLQLLLNLFLIVWFWIKCNHIYKTEFSFFFYWVLINYFTVLATMYLPLLKYIGEGFKYLIYGTFPVSLLVSFAIVNLVPEKLIAYAILLLLVGAGLCIQFFTLRRQMLNTNAYVDDEFKKVMQIIKNSDLDNILCIPVFKSEPLAYFTDKKVLWGGHGSGWNHLNEIYPIIRTPIEDLMKKYTVNLIMLDKRFVDLADLKVEKYIEKIFDGHNYLLARVI